MQFKHLNVPDQWQHYWTKYPEGYTIMEALISWVSQVDDMTDNVNNWNEYLDEFVITFDKELQNTVTNIISDWQQSGFLDLVINSALQWQLDDYIETNEQKLGTINQQLAQKVGGGKLATMGDLSQDVKEAMTGGSVAVVGEGAVGMVNLNNELSAIINEWLSVLTNENQNWSVG